MSPDPIVLVLGAIVTFGAGYYTHWLRSSADKKKRIRDFNSHIAKWRADMRGANERDQRYKLYRRTLGDFIGAANQVAGDIPAAHRAEFSRLVDAAGAFTDGQMDTQTDARELVELLDQIASITRAP